MPLVCHVGKQVVLGHDARAISRHLGLVATCEYWHTPTAGDGLCKGFWLLSKNAEQLG